LVLLRLTLMHLTYSTSLSFFNATATPEIYTLSLHDALPIFGLCLPRKTLAMVVAARPSTSSFTSMTTQLRWTVCLLPITVFMRPFSPKGGVLYWIRSSVSTFAALRILPGKEGVHVGVGHSPPDSAAGFRYFP